MARALLLPLMAGSLRLAAAEPVLTHFHPAAVRAGDTVTVSTAGSFNPWPCRIWTDDPRLVFTPLKEAGSFSVKAAPDVPPGPHLVRAFNDEGASAPVFIVVTAEPQTAEKEPNDSFGSPQVVASPVASCTGRLDRNGDVDSWQIDLKQGAVLTARIEANRLAAGIDPMLRLVDSSGTVQAFNHDHFGMDPFLAFTAPHDGPFIVQVMGHRYPATSEVGFAGGPDAVYRLHLSTGPVVSHTWPLRLTRGRPARASLVGWNLPAAVVTIDPAAPPDFPVLSSDVPEFTESRNAPALQPPAAVSGRLDTPGEIDRHAFHATRGKPLVLTVEAPVFGSPVDPVLRVLDKDGREVAAMDDAGGTTEPTLTWTPPADGLWFAAVRNLTRKGGPDCVYRLAIAPAVPTVAATVAAHAFRVAPGRTVDIKVSVTRRHGHAAPLRLAARDLPPGLSATEAAVPDKPGDATLTLTAAPDAAAAAAPFRLVLVEPDSGREHAVVFRMVSSSEDNGVPRGFTNLLIEETPLLWLTVAGAAPPGG